MDIHFRHGKKRCESNMLREGFLKLRVQSFKKKLVSELTFHCERQKYITFF